jgi:flagellar basal body-associated protein FliL
MELSISDEKTKELLRNKRDLIRDILLEALEEVEDLHVHVSTCLPLVPRTALA